MMADTTQLETAPRFSQPSTPTYSDLYGRKVYEYSGSPWL